MASGTRSIVWRSDIDAGRGRPAFFCGLVAKGAGKAQLVEQFAAQLSGTQLSSSQLFQLFTVLLAREGRGERGGREGGEGGGRKKVEEMEEDGKLLVEQIKTKNGAFPRRVVLYYCPTICFAFSTT